MAEEGHHNLDRALARQHRRLNPEIFNPIKIRTVDDIKKCIAELSAKNNPKHGTVQISTIMEVEEKGGKTTYNVNAPTTSRSKREILILALDKIKTRMKQLSDYDEKITINNREMPVAKLQSVVIGYNWIDPLIERWFGARRDGYYILWDLDGSVYKYDIFEHKLTRYSNE